MRASLHSFTHFFIHRNPTLTKCVAWNLPQFIDSNFKEPLALQNPTPSIFTSIPSHDPSTTSFAHNLCTENNKAAKLAWLSHSFVFQLTSKFGDRRERNGILLANIWAVLVALKFSSSSFNRLSATISATFTTQLFLQMKISTTPFFNPWFKLAKYSPC